MELKISKWQVFVFPLRSSPAQLKMHVCVGMFQDLFNSHLPCPSQVSQFLFKVLHQPFKMLVGFFFPPQNVILSRSHQLMSVHNERMVSEKALKALCDIACTAAYQIGQCPRAHALACWIFLALRLGISAWFSCFREKWKTKL